MNHIKRKYDTKKVGFSGTLDPFATGCLIVATGQYTKLFQYLSKTPKTYTATLWLGANSPSLDIERVDSIKQVSDFSQETIEKTLCSLKGKLTYYPPKFSAKKINGKRAYELARNNQDVQLKTITSTIYSIELINYNHPFIHFKAKVSEGTYIRSLGALIADKLNTDATLSSLQRIQEGKFYYDDEKALNPFTHLHLERNTYKGNKENIELGKKLNIKHFTRKDNGIYIIDSINFFSIVEIVDNEIKYKLNRIQKSQDQER